MTKVLIVEDDFMIATMLKDLLEAKGYKTMHAADGPAGLDLARKEKPELLLLDIMIPGVNGFDVCRMLKTDPATQAIKIIMTTALNRMSDVDKAFTMGASDYLIKPFDNNRLFDKIERVLAQK